MKRKIFPFSYLFLALAIGWAAPAAAQDLSALYVTPKVMTSYQRGEMPGGFSERGSVFGLGLSVGTDLSYATSLPLRLEAEYLWHGSQTFNQPGVSSHEVSAHSFLANAFFDIHTDSALTPYLGGGLGMACLNDRVRVDNNSTKTSSWNFAWNLGGGVAWSLSESLALDLGYRYMALGKTQDFVHTDTRTTNADLTAHEFGLGLRIMAF